MFLKIPYFDISFKITIVFNSLQMVQKTSNTIRRLEPMEEIGWISVPIRHWLHVDRSRNVVPWRILKFYTPGIYKCIKNTIFKTYNLHKSCTYTFFLLTLLIQILGTMAQETSRWHETPKKRRRIFVQGIFEWNHRYNAWHMQL